MRNTMSIVVLSLIQTDEDEETRAYRLEIEKQKAQREKILRDKEMRRRKAAEELKKDDVSWSAIDFEYSEYSMIAIFLIF